MMAEASVQHMYQLFPFTTGPHNYIHLLLEKTLYELLSIWPYTTNQLAFDIDDPWLELSLHRIKGFWQLSVGCQ